MYCKPTLFIKSIKIISLLTLEVNDPRDSTTFSYFIINKSKIAMCGTIVQLSTTLMMDEAGICCNTVCENPTKSPMSSLNNTISCKTFLKIFKHHDQHSKLNITSSRSVPISRMFFPFQEKGVNWSPQQHQTSVKAGEKEAQKRDHLWLKELDLRLVAF